MEIGTKIKVLREERNLSQRSLAKSLDISQTTLHYIETGQSKKIDFTLMDKICKLFNVDFEYFTDGKQVNNVETNTGAIAYRIDNFNNFPENLIEQIKLLFEDNENKDLEIERLKSELKK